MKIKTITLFGIIFHIIGIIKGQHQGIIFKPKTDNCIHTSGQPGSCIIFHRCQRHLIGPNLNGNTCGFEGNTPKICCPDQNTTRTSASEPLKVFSPKVNFECGEGNWSQNTRIYIQSVGSVEAIPNEWPWAVLVGAQVNLIDITWICTGSLINHKFVLSAAHCVLKSPNIIRLGEHSILNDNDEAHTDSNIINTFVNPNYKIKPSYHDLVLFEMELDAVFRPNSINPICLPWSDTKQINYSHKKTTFVGWGATEYKGEFSDVLLKAEIELFDGDVCDEIYKLRRDYKLNFPQGITEEFYICAGNQTASVDTCSGDSGGPLMYKEGNKYFICGVTSLGYGCGSKKYPGLYVNVRHVKYLQWIKEIAF